MKIGIALLSILITLPAFAAKFHIIPEATRLKSLQKKMEAVCEIALLVDNNCLMYVLKVDEKSPAEPWISTVKQLQYSSQYVEQVSGRRLSKADVSIVKALNHVIEQSKLDQKSQFGIAVIDALMAQVNRDAYNKATVEVIAGRIQGLLSLDQRFIAFIDTTENEILILQAGYSE